jgi:hypothetical protein
MLNSSKQYLLPAGTDSDPENAKNHVGLDANPLIPYNPILQKLFAPSYNYNLMRKTAKVFLVLLLSFTTCLITLAQSPFRSNQGIVLKTPSLAEQRATSILAAPNAYGSIQAAINSQPVGPVLIYLSCGVYIDNVVISSSDVRLHGAERGCVQIEPANPALPVIDINSTNTSGIGFDEVSDVSIICPTGQACADGLRITGRTDIQQQNDFHKFSRVGIYGSFQNGIDITGRTIWSTFENIEVGFIHGNGINIVGSGTVNELTFRNIRTANNYGYGIYLNNTQVNLVNGIDFDVVNAEYNGQNTGLADCAGIYLTGISQANIQNSYFEGNCLGNIADATSAEVRITGTFAQAVNITGTVFNQQYGEGGIYNDAIQTTGTYQGNKFTTTTNKFTIYVATSHAQSNVVIGENFNASPIIIPDGNGVTHVHTLSPFGFDYAPISSVIGNSIDVSTSNALTLYNGPFTISTLNGGHIGQVIYLSSLNASGHVLTNGAGGPGQILFPDGMNRVLNAGESILLYFDGSSWRPIEGNITTLARHTATVTTTASASDQVSVPDLTASAHCIFSARNAVAASMQGVFVSVNSGELILNHAPAPGGIFDVFCSAN